MNQAAGAPITKPSHAQPLHVRDRNSAAWPNRDIDSLATAGRDQAGGTLSDEDAAYYYRRAEEELALAQASGDAKLVSFHFRLAGLYLDRVFAPEELARVRR